MAHMVLPVGFSKMRHANAAFLDWFGVKQNGLAGSESCITSQIQENHSAFSRGWFVFIKHKSLVLMQNVSSVSLLANGWPVEYVNQVMNFWQHSLMAGCRVLQTSYFEILWSVISTFSQKCVGSSSRSPGAQFSSGLSTKAEDNCKLNPKPKSVVWACSG